MYTLYYLKITRMNIPTGYDVKLQSVLGDKKKNRFSRKKARSSFVNKTKTQESL